MADSSGSRVCVSGSSGWSSGGTWGGLCAGGGCICMCLSLVGLSYRADSCIRLVDSLDQLSIDRLSRELDALNLIGLSSGVGHNEGLLRKLLSLLLCTEFFHHPSTTIPDACSNFSGHCLCAVCARRRNT